MQTGSAPGTAPEPNEKRDLFFKCEQCGIPLVVDCSAAGMTLTCQHCGKPTAVPTSGVAELQCRMKENESQRTEVTSYINQLNIQLHRWQLRLQMLDDRNKELSAELAARHSHQA